MKRLIIITFFYFILTPQLWAGWKIVSHEIIEGNQQTITYFIEKDRLRISGNGFEFIYDNVEKKITVVNHKIKSFYMGSFEDYTTQFADLKRINKSLVHSIFPKTFIQRLDTALSERVKDNQNDSIQEGPNLIVKKSKSKAKIASSESIKYQVYCCSSLVQTIWFSSSIQISNDINLFQVVNFLNGISESSPSQSKILNKQAYHQLINSGFPLKQENIDSDDMLSFSKTCISIDEVALDIEENFTSPQSYQKLTLIDLILVESQN